jgi:hypothetical protein
VSTAVVSVQTLVVSHFVESLQQAFVESHASPDFVASPQDTRRADTANITNNFFIVYFFLFLFIYEI